MCQYFKDNFATFPKKQPSSDTKTYILLLFFLYTVFVSKLRIILCWKQYKNCLFNRIVRFFFNDKTLKDIIATFDVKYEIYDKMLL